MFPFRSPSPVFQVSSFCQSGACVEVARIGADRIAVRDTKSRFKAKQVYTNQEWAAFVKGVKAGEFDLGVTESGPSGTSGPL